MELTPFDRMRLLNTEEVNKVLGKEVLKARKEWQ